MTKWALCAAVFLTSIGGLRADQFSFSYSGSGVSVKGTVIATASSPGVYTVTNIYGTRNSAAFDNSPVGGVGFTFNGTSGVGILAFSVGSLGLLDTVTFAGGNYAEAGFVGATTGNNFSMSRVPEAATLTLLLAMGLGTIALARKLPTRRRG